MNYKTLVQRRGIIFSPFSQDWNVQNKSDHRLRIGLYSHFVSMPWYAHLTQFPDKLLRDLLPRRMGPVPRPKSPANICFLISMAKLCTKRWNDDLVVNFGGACFAGKFYVLVV